MNKILTYLLVILIFLGISTSFPLSERGTDYILNEKVFANYFTEEGPLSLILSDYFQTGFLIKTFYQKYKVVYAFKRPQYVILRTSPEFWKKNLKNLGMSIYRKREHDNIGENIVLPPGSLYIGNLAYGNWVLMDSGERIWRFYRGHRHLSANFGWGNFRPSKKFYEKMKFHLINEKPFYGLDNEFGTDGEVTKQSFLRKKEKSTKSENKLMKILKKFGSLPKTIQKDA